MAGSGQAPTPYDGMGQPTRWDMQAQNDGSHAERNRLVAGRTFRARHATSRGERRFRASLAPPLLPVISARTDRRSDVTATATAQPDGSVEPARQLTGAQIALESLIREGVDTIFGYPGGANLWLYRHLPSYPQLHHILVRHEQGGAHAADGYARSKRGSVGVVFATSGPGALNLVTGLATAYMDSVPVVAITGQVPSTAIGTDSFQESDVIGSTMSVVKHSYLITRVEDIAPTIKEAFHIARSGRPGPVLIDFPKDLQAAMSTFNYPKARSGAVRIRRHHDRIPRSCGASRSSSPAPSAP